MNPVVLSLAFSAAILGSLLVKFWLATRQLRHVAAHRAAVPSSFAATVPLAAHQKAADYTLAKLRLGIVDSAFSSAILIAWTLLGGLGALNAVLLDWAAPRWGSMVYQLLLVGAFTLISSLIDLPFELYRTFRLEQRFGFNKMTPALFIGDLVKSTGLGIVIGQVITLVFGRQVQFAESPLSGAARVLGTAYSEYRLLLVGVAVALGLGLAWVMNGTRLGLVTRAVIANEDLAQSLGVDTTRVRFATFGLGSALASLAGALVVPLSSVDPNMGVPWLVGAFMLVLLSGSSLVAMAMAALVLGGAQVLVSTYLNAVLGGMTVAVLAAIILRIRPAGFARA